MKNVRLGLLDFGLRGGTTNSLRILRDLVEYAQHADQLGFERIWLAEHYYGHKTHAWTTPEPLIGVLASATKNIRVGTAGILLSIHQPFHIAARFKLLNSLFNNRIDLGVVNGRVSDKVKAYALQDSSKDIKAGFDQSLDELLFFLRNEDELFNGGDGIVLPPYKAAVPELWGMSGSLNGLDRTLRKEMNFSRSLFHKGADLEPHKELMHAFKERYQASFGYAPKINLALSGVCLEGYRAGRNDHASEKEHPEHCHMGCPDRFYDVIANYQETFGVDEFIFTDLLTSHSDRMKSLEQIQKRFN